MKKAETSEFGKRLNELRIENNYTMDEMCAAYNEKFNNNLSKGTLSKYENGIQEPMVSTVKSLSEFFGTTMEYLTGKSNNKYTEISETSSKKVVPILGVIAAGRPIYAEEHIEGYEQTEDNGIDFCLRVTGTSMIGARIYEGDIVFVDANSIIENGDIVVALVDGENATLKKYYRYGNKVILRPENPSMKEMEFGIKDKDFKIIGKVKEVKFKV